MCSLLAVIVDGACGLGERHLTPARPWGATVVNGAGSMPLAAIALAGRVASEAKSRR